MLDWRVRAGNPIKPEIVSVREVMSIKWSATLVGMMLLWMAFTRPCGSVSASSSISRTEADQPVSLQFSGSPNAELFTRELDASFQGVLKKNFVSVARDGFPAGFVNASLSEIGRAHV